MNKAIRAGPLKGRRNRVKGLLRGGAMYQGLEAGNGKDHSLLAEKVRKDLISAFRLKGIRVSRVHIEMKQGRLNIRVLMEDSQRNLWGAFRFPWK